MANVLTKDYKPRDVYYTEHSIDHPKNIPYVNQLITWCQERILTSAKPYHEKHFGVKNRGAIGKEINITRDDLRKMIIDSNGKSPNGIDIHFAPVGILRKPGEAERLGLVTSEQRSRFPSVDRINSSKGYISGNIQLSTKSYNLGKSNNDVKYDLKEKLITATIKWYGIEVSINEITSSFLANTMKELAK